MQQPLIIAVAGEMESGKSTVSQFVMDCLAAHKGYRFQPLGFADRLKNGAVAMHGYDREKLDQDWYKRETDPVLGVPRRKVLQTIGTEYGRDMLREDIWINYVDLDIQAHIAKGWSTMITDLRFENELALVDRGWDGARTYTVKIKNPHSTTDYSKVHVSERPLADELFDFVFTNDKTAGLQAMMRGVAAEIVAPIIREQAA